MRFLSAMIHVSQIAGYVRGIGSHNTTSSLERLVEIEYLWKVLLAGPLLGDFLSL